VRAAIAASDTAAIHVEGGSDKDSYGLLVDDTRQLRKAEPVIASGSEGIGHGDDAARPM
jgi:hypothetical protein